MVEDLDRLEASEVIEAKRQTARGGVGEEGEVGLGGEGWLRSVQESAGAKARADHRGAGEDGALPLGRREIEQAVVHIGITVEAQVDIGIGALDEADKDSVRDDNRGVEEIATETVEAIGTHTLGQWIGIDEGARSAGRVVPDGQRERDILVIVVAGAVEEKIDSSKGVGDIEVETAGNGDLRAGRDGAVAVFRGTVVVGIVVVEDLKSEKGIVAGVVVASDALADDVPDRKRGRLR